MNVQVNGVILYYEKQGSGPPLVLLHGNGEDGRIFDRRSIGPSLHRLHH